MTIWTDSRKSKQVKLHDFLSPYFLVRFLGGWPLGMAMVDLSKKSTVSSSSVSVVNALLGVPLTLRKFFSGAPFVPLVPLTDCRVRPLRPGKPPDAGPARLVLLPYCEPTPLRPDSFPDAGCLSNASIIFWSSILFPVLPPFAGEL